MTDGGSAAAVRFEDVTKAYGKSVAVRSLNFEVAAGSLVTLLGPSGCGKTTTLRLIAGLEAADVGRIFIGDRDVTRLPVTDRDISMVFQSYALFPHMSVVDNVAYGLVVSGVAKRAARAQAEQRLAMVGLKNMGRRMPSELSGGQQQRVAVARALVLEPSVLLFDEPLSNLDAKLRRRVREDIRELQQQLELTAVYVTHDQEEALAVSDRIIVMKDAAIAQEGSPRELYEQPASRFVADFIGDANLVPGRVLAVEGEVADLDVGGLRYRLPHRNCSKGDVEVAVRPEAIRLDAGAGAVGIAAKVRKATYLGSHIQYRVESALGELFVTDKQVDALITPGTDVSMSFAEHGITLLGP